MNSLTTKAILFILLVVQIQATNTYKGVYNTIPILNSIQSNKSNFTKERYINREHLIFLERYHNYMFEVEALKLKKLLRDLPMKDEKRISVEKKYKKLISKRVLEKKLYQVRMKNY